MNYQNLEYFMIAKTLYYYLNKLYRKIRYTISLARSQ